MLPDPDTLSGPEIQANTATRVFGKVLHCRERVDSTNGVARGLAEEGAPEGTVVLADEQTQGRGRLGRSWFSPPRSNLYFSLILRPDCAPGDAPQITLVAAVALAEVVESLLGYAPEIKWPNDVLVGGRKLAGILTESTCEGGHVKYVILGIGINVNLAMAALPEALRARATSLSELSGTNWSRNRVAGLLIQGLERCYKDLDEHGFAAMALRWGRFFTLREKEIEVHMLDQVVRGVALGIDVDGALILRDPQGAIQRVIAGDVFPAGSEPCC